MSEKNGSSGAKPDVDALRAEIEQTRTELGETVQALAAKADVKARAREQVEQTKQRAREQVEQTKQRVMAQAAEATGKVRDAALVASDKVRQTAGQASATARDAVAEAGEKAQGTTYQVRRSPLPVGPVLIGVMALVGVILIVRGRRR